MAAHGANSHDHESRCNSTGVFRRNSWSQHAATEIDSVVVDRLVAGRTVDCTAWERRAAVRRMRIAGHSYSQIAATLGISQRQIARDLRRAGLAHRRNDLIAGAARQRRVIVERLARAELRPTEIRALLPDTSYQQVLEDMHHLGLRHGPDSRRCRSRDELLATHGHLLELMSEAASRGLVAHRRRRLLPYLHERTDPSPPSRSSSDDPRQNGGRRHVNPS